MALKTELIYNQDMYNRRVFDPALKAIWDRNAKIFKETTAVIKNGYYTAPSGARVELPSLQPMLKGEECVHTQLPRTTVPVLLEGTKVIVEQNDCLEATRRLVEKGYHPALLNFASGSHPGGGVEKGARAQEETICRRSTLSRSIFTFDRNFAERFGYNHKEGDNYPLRSLNHSIIYSPAVTVFRKGRECQFMEKPYQCGVITCAALNLNGEHSIKLTSDGRMSEDAKSITANKIRAIFRMGLRHGHDSLVLGAFGCGAFRNPPEEMAMLFRQILGEEEFRDRYRLVTFAIIEDHNAHGHNYNAFQKVFSEQ